MVTMKDPVKDSNGNYLDQDETCGFSEQIAADSSQIGYEIHTKINDYNKEVSRILDSVEKYKHAMESKYL